MKDTRVSDTDTPSVAGSTDIPFIFLGGSLALDLVNTEVMARGVRRDLLAVPGDLSLWWGAAQTEHDDAACVPALAEGVVVDDALFAAVRCLRDALRMIVSAQIEGHPGDATALATLNQTLALGRPYLSPSTQEACRFVYTTSDAASALLFVIALSAARLLSEADLRRLHQCRSERCILFFYDTTKSGTRQWCSLGCMNRARSIANYRERKGQHDDPD